MTMILAIESSCDETACAVVRDGNQILSNIVSSQINVHTLYGGVVPEVASRIHVENISAVVAEALQKADVTMDDIDAVAYTQGPGLIGSLHVGVQAAKTIAWAFGKPLVPVNHMCGHIYANSFVADLKFPLMALVISGGHTELVYMKNDWDFKVIGTTRDDAVGEAYDKVARILGLGYPGGPVIDKLAREGKEHYKLPVPKVQGEYESMLIAELSRGIDLYDVMTSEEFEAETLSEEEIVEYLIATGVPVESFNFYVEDEKEH